MDRKLLGITYVIIATIGYSMITIFVKLGIDSGLNGLYITGMSFSLATLIFWGIAFITRRKMLFSFWYLSICAAANISMYYLQTKALSTISVSLYIILFFTFPIFIVILNTLIFKQKVGKQKLLSLAFSICGLILSIGIFQEASVKLSILGIIYSLLGALFNAVFFISLQQALKKTDNVVSLCYIFSITAIFSLAACKASGGWINSPNLGQILHIDAFDSFICPFCNIYDKRNKNYRCFDSINGKFISADNYPYSCKIYVW